MEPTKIIGLVLDLSLRHNVAGERMFDIVKREMGEYLLRVVDGEDLFYLYNTESLRPVQRIGEITAALANYETDGWVFDVGFALKQTLFVLLAEDEDIAKQLIVVTNRLQDASAVEKILKLQHRDQSECRIVVVGIGSGYNRAALEKVNDPLFSFFHVEATGVGLCDQLIKGEG